MGAFHILLQVIEYIASWFVHPDNKTGCRFIVVDAYNKENVLHFYEKNVSVRILGHYEFGTLKNS